MADDWLTISSRRLPRRFSRLIDARVSRPDSSLPDVGRLWRERIFFAVVYFGLAVGLPVLVFTTLLAAIGGFWTGVTIFGPAYLFVFGVTFHPRLSFHTRVVLIMLLIYGGGTASLIAVGPHFAGRLWLVAFAAFSCLMLGFRAGMVAVGMNTLTAIGLGLFFGLATKNPAILSGGLGQDIPFPTYWLLTSLAFVVLSLVIVVAIALLFRGLENTLKSERRSSRDLEEEREYLDLANRELEQEIRQRREAEEALKKSENQYRSLVEKVPFGIFIVEIDSGRFLFLNRQICDLHGYDIEEALQLEVSDFVDPAQHDLMRSRIATRLADGHLSPATVVYTTRAKDGTAIRSEVWTSVVDFQGRPAVQGVVRDVTEQELLQKQLQQAQKMEAVGTLAGGVAHEFNNILMAIRGYTQLLTMNGGLEAKPAGYIEKIEACTKRAADLTGKMLTFSRLDSGDKIPVQVNEAVEEIGDLARHTFSPIYRFELALAPDLPDIGANPYHLEQVLLNLAVNARDAMPEGGRIAIQTFLVDVDAEFRRVNPWAVADRYVEVVVEDQGCGMTAEQIERIFDPFYTTKDPGEGTGLGLAVAYSIIENHGGAIVAHSRPGQGSRFHVYLPVEEVLPVAIESAAPRDDREVTGRSILLVDDEDLVRDVARQALEHFGCRVVEAGQGREALDLYRDARDQGQPFDLVLLDMAMPIMGGPECLDRLLEMDPGVRVLIVTGHDGQPGQDLLSRTRGVLHKPFDLIRLRREIAQALAVGNEPDQ